MNHTVSELAPKVSAPFAQLKQGGQVPRGQIRDGSGLPQQSGEAPTGGAPGGGLNTKTSW
jgi:hypothetical protein